MIYDGFGKCQVFRELWGETCFDVKYSGQELSRFSCLTQNTVQFPL